MREKSRVFVFEFDGPIIHPCEDTAWAPRQTNLAFRRGFGAGDIILGFVNKDI